MIDPSTPPPDVDALARRLPRHEPPRERMLASRRALLEAAELPPQPWIARGWLVGGGAVLAATVCALVAWHTLGSHAPQPLRATASTAPDAAVAGDPLAGSAPAGRAVGTEPLADGATTLETRRPTQLARGGTTITAPAGARFDVDVRDGHVQRVTVQAGWVVIAAARGATKMVVARETWILPAPAPTAPAPAAAAPRVVTGAPSTPSAPSTRAAAPPRAAPAVTVAPPPAPRAAPAVTVAAPPSPRAADSASPATVVEAQPTTPAEASRPAAIPTSERDFRDGLRALLAGDPHKAIAALDRACAVPSSTQADVCYWAAVAWLRAGDRTRARRGFDDILIRFPGATHAGEANVALGWLLLDAGDRVGARARFAAAANDAMLGVRTDALRGLAAAR